MKQREIVHDAIAEYTKIGLNGVAYLMQNPDKNLLSVISQSVQRGQQYVSVNLLVRLVAHIIVIEHDANNKPLYEALMQEGLPVNTLFWRMRGRLSQNSNNRRYTTIFS